MTDETRGCAAAGLDTADCVTVAAEFRAHLLRRQQLASSAGTRRENHRAVYLWVGGANVQLARPSRRHLWPGGRAAGRRGWNVY